MEKSQKVQQPQDVIQNWSLHIFDGAQKEEDIHFWSHVDTATNILSIVDKFDL